MKPERSQEGAMSRAIAPTDERPKHPDGTYYQFNCCALPDVWEYGDGSFQCRNCGYDWTGVLDAD